jgi:serine/threonine protein kinase
MLPIPPDTLLQQRYRILNLLEDGDLGRTYLAIDGDRSDAKCAIDEIVPTSQFPSVLAKAKESFAREIALLSQLQHSQISRFWATFEADNRLFVVRDYVAGKTYRQILTERRALDTTFSESEVWQFLLQILPAIGYIHTKGTIHGEISPEHIICRDLDRLPVLTNFGAVKEFANKLHANPQTEQPIVGQLGYAPREQIQQRQVYPSSDLYALAVTAIVLLTGKEPSALFEGDRMNWDWRKWSPIDDDFANILGRMLNLEPQDRYQSALEVNRDLQSLNILNRPAPAPTPGSNRPSTIPTVAVEESSTPASPKPLQAAMTNLNAKSIWEKPQVFIPVGAAIALLAGVGSYFGISQLLHSKSSEPTANTPPKQIDFNNPTIPTDSTSPSSIAANETIQPEMGKEIFKEGTVDAKSPMRYRISALAGQNLDIQLAATSSQTTDPAKSISSPIDPLNPVPSSSPSPTTKSSNPPISLPNGSPATQVLMTILSPSGAAIDSQADRVVSWRGQIPTSGDYTIELRPITGLSGTSFPYKLSVMQLATTTTTPTPSATTTPDPTATTTPTPSSTEPSGVPIPIDGYINTPTPSTTPSPTPASEGSSTSPSVTPSVSPTPTPSESSRPTRKRRRNRTRTQPSPSTTERETVRSTEETPTSRRRRARVESTEETTPTPRRRRRRVESTEETTPTPRRRRARQTDSEQSKPSPANNSNSEEQKSTPTPEPSVGIPVPPAKSSTPRTNGSDGDKTNENSTVDTD